MFSSLSALTVASFIAFNVQLAVSKNVIDVYQKGIALKKEVAEQLKQDVIEAHVDDLVFKFIGCRAQQGQHPFECLFVVQNKSTADKSIRIHRDARTVLYDGLGYAIDRPEIEYGGSSRSRAVLPPGVDVAVVVSFPGIPREGISQIQISGNTTNPPRRFIANFTDIPN